MAIMARQSIAKKSVLKIIKNASTPVSSTEIQLKCNLFNRATIYRTLITLKEENLVRLIEIGDGSLRYESIEDHYHHLICSKCKTIQRIDLPKNEEKRLIKIQQKFQRETKFIDLEHSLEFFGLCSHCKNI
jgi:Fe2+ or Zn2+ uptake regulation protein